MTVLTARRTISRVTPKQRLGPDAQVDDKAILIAPGDPALTDPFLMMAEDWFSSPGFEWHPHRGIETVTTVLDGVLEHGDNLGNAGALEPGDVQWMTAGRGIIHRELAYRDEHAHTLQLWLNLPARKKMVDTRYQDVRAAGRPRVTLPSVVLDVVSGTVEGATGPALNHSPVQGVIVTARRRCPVGTYGPARPPGPTRRRAPARPCSSWPPALALRLPRASWSTAVSPCASPSPWAAPSS